MYLDSLIIMAAKAALEDKAMSLIPKYMMEQNRPYSATDVFTNLRQEFGKALVLRALEHGVALGVLKEKIISKQKLFYVDQDKLPVADEEALIELDKEVNSKSEIFASVSNKYKIVQNDLSSFRNEETIAKLTELLEESREKVSTMRERLRTLEESRENSSIKDAEAQGKILMDKEAGMASLAKKRKRIACDMLNAIRENNNTPKKKLYESIGVEIKESELDK